MLYSSNVCGLNNNLQWLNANSTRTITDVTKQIGMVKIIGKDAESLPWNNKECKMLKKSMKSKLKACSDNNFSSEEVKSYISCKSNLKKQRTI